MNSRPRILRLQSPVPVWVSQILWPTAFFALRDNSHLLCWITTHSTLSNCDDRQLGVCWSGLGAAVISCDRSLGRYACWRTRSVLFSDFYCFTSTRFIDFVAIVAFVTGSVLDHVRVRISCALEILEAVSTPCEPCRFVVKSWHLPE